MAGYANRRLYINRREAFNRNLSLGEVQRRAADFALQFRDISRVVPACDLRGGAASDAYMQRLRNGYFPKRSGDLLVDLVPGRIEERAGIRSSAAGFRMPLSRSRLTWRRFPSHWRGFWGYSDRRRLPPKR